VLIIIIIIIIITRHSLEGKGEVLVLLYVFFVCSLFCQRFLDNLRANSRQILHAGVLWFPMFLLLFWVLAAPGAEKGEMKFSLLQESMGNFGTNGGFMSVLLKHLLLVLSHGLSVAAGLLVVW